MPRHKCPPGLEEMAHDCHSREEGGLSWWVPLTFSGPGAGFNTTYSKLWLGPDEGTKVVTGMPEGEQPVIFNVQQTGFYRYSHLKSRQCNAINYIENV